MRLKFPKKVTLIEVWPRDGFQFEAKIISTDLKIEIISCLVNAGIQCAFRCVFEGKISQEKVLEMTRNFLDCDVDMIAISDTSGMASPVA